MPTLDELLQVTKPDALSNIGRPKQSLDDLMIEAKALGGQTSDNISATSHELAMARGPTNVQPSFREPNITVQPLPDYLQAQRQQLQATDTKAVKDYLENEKYKPKDILSSTSDKDFDFIFQIVAKDPQSFTDNIGLIARENAVRRKKKELEMMSQREQTIIYAVTNFGNLFNLNEYLDRKGLNPFSKGEHSLTLEAVDRLLAERPLSPSKVSTQVGVQVPKILLEFWALPDVGSKLKMLKKVPKLRSMVLAATKFGLREAVQAPSREETLTERAKTVGISGAMGAGVGATGAFVPSTAIRAPLNIAGFSLLTHAMGGSKEDVIQTAATVGAFEALGLVKKGEAALGKKYRRGLEKKALRSRVLHVKNGLQKKGIDITKVPEYALENLVKSADKYQWWETQYKKGKITNKTFNMRTEPEVETIRNIFGAISRSQGRPTPTKAKPTDIIRKPATEPTQPKQPTPVMSKPAVKPEFKEKPEISRLAEAEKPEISPKPLETKEVTGEKEKYTPPAEAGAEAANKADIFDEIDEAYDNNDIKALEDIARRIKGTPTASIRVGTDKRLAGFEETTLAGQLDHLIANIKAQAKPPSAAAAKAGAEAAEKQPWEMTQAEYTKTHLYSVTTDLQASRSKYGVEAWHSTISGLTKSEAEAHVQKALKAGDYAKMEKGELGSAKGHKMRVHDAIVIGKPVPAEVLAEYPDLAKQEKVAEAEVEVIDWELVTKGTYEGSKYRIKLRLPDEAKLVAQRVKTNRFPITPSALAADMRRANEKAKTTIYDTYSTLTSAVRALDKMADIGYLTKKGANKWDYKNNVLTSQAKYSLAKQAQPPAIAEGKKIKGRKQPRKGLADIAFVGKAYRGIMSIIEPAKLAQAKVGKEPVAAVMRGTFGKRERARVEFEQGQLDEMDKTFSRLERDLSKYTNEDLENLMLSRGKVEGDSAKKIQNKAKAALPMEWKTPEYQKALQEIADYNYKKLQEVVGDDINKARDYFYGIYKEPKKVSAFLKYWKTTKRFTKEKVFPTYADAKAYGLEIRNPNPVTNLKSEYVAIAQLEAMKWLKDELMRTGEGKFIDLTENAPFNYVIIGEGTRPEPTFSDVRVEASLGKLINNLISTNKITKYPALNTLRQVNNFLRTVKFVGSAFHLKNIAKQSFADSGYFGVYKRTATKGLTGGFRKDDPIFKTPEYLDYIENGGGHRYSVESEARRAFSDAIKKLTKSERAILKAGGLPFKIPVKFVDWMFESYIPKVKYAKYLDFVAEREKKLGRILKPSEKQEIIKEQQNFYGMMNERLFGRSGTVTTALRFWFMAPGYAEGNYRTILKAATQWGGKEGYKASRSRSNIVNSLLVSGIAATIGTLIMTGKPPKKPETIEETRDLFKMDTGKKDKRGNPIMIDMLSYDKDYWNIYFNVLRGRPDIAADATIKRIGGMKAPTAQMAVDLALMAQGKAIYDFKEDKVYHLTDPFLQKVIKTTIHELERTIPISASVFKRAKQKEIDEVLSAVAALTGTQLTTGEKQKEEFKIVQDLWDMGEKREKLSYTLDKYEDPWKAIEQYNNTLKKIIDSKFITDELKKKAESRLIDPKKAVNWKRFPPKQLTTSQLWQRFRSMTYKKDQDETRNFMKWRLHKGYEEAGKATRDEILRRQKGHK